MNKHRFFLAAWLMLMVIFPMFGNDAIYHTAAFQGRDQLWQSFRKKFPYHIQTIALSQAASDGSWLILISEPPPHIDSTGFAQSFKDLKPFIDIKTQLIGADGWSKDVLLVLPKTDRKVVEQALLYLHRRLFHTIYKAHFLELSQIETVDMRPPERVNYRISVLELRKWLFLEPERFQSIDDIAIKNTSPSVSNLSLGTIFDNGIYGVYMSKRKGLVAWILPKSQSLFGFKADIRQFALETDAILGAVADGNSVAIIGKARTASVYAQPPMRTETILTLAATEGGHLYQSYERLNPMAGRLSNNKDWAPAVLSDELLNTEMGSLLNIADHMLKSWSEDGKITYQGFETYPKPKTFMPSVYQAMRTKSLTYNWNASVASVQTKLDIGNENFDFVALNRLNCLPVRYMASGKKDNLGISQQEAEQNGLAYFSGLNDPVLSKVAGYTALFQIFKSFDIHAERPEIPSVSKLGTAALIQKNHLLMRHFRPLTTSERNAAAKRFANTMFNDFSTIQANVQETMPNTPSEDCGKAYLKLKKDTLLILLKRRQGNPQALQELQAKSVELDNKNQVYDKAVNDARIQLDGIQAAIKPIAKFGESGFALLDTLMIEEIGLPVSFEDNPTRRDNQIAEIRRIAHILRDTFDISQYASAVLNEPLDVICMDYQKANHASQGAWLKTPTVVISWHKAGDSLMSTGGHSLDISQFKFQVEKTLEAGQMGRLPNGVILVSEADAAKISPDLVKKIYARLERLDKTCNKLLITPEQYRELKLKEIAASFNDIQLTSEAAIVRSADDVLPPSVSSNVFVPENLIAGELPSDIRLIQTTEIEDILFIEKTDNNSCESMINDIVEHIKKNKKSSVKIQFKNVKDEQVQGMLDAARMKTGQNVLRGKIEDISTHLCDFTKMTMRVDKAIQIDSKGMKDILVEIPLLKTPSVKTRLTIRSVANKWVEKAKEKLTALVEKAKGTRFNFVEALKNDLKEAGINYAQIEMEFQDCFICQITIDGYEGHCSIEIAPNPAQPLPVSDCATDDGK